MSCWSNVLFHNQDRSLSVVVPSSQLLDQSLCLIAPDKPFNGWSAQMHADSYLFMQRIAQAWKVDRFTDQYLIYGKIGSSPFNWEMVPYKKCWTCVGRVVQQLQVLLRTVFGGVTVSKESRKSQVRRYEALLSTSPKIIGHSGGTSRSNDPFCKDDTIERQLVLTGKKVNVLFNYAPIGFGGERLHFLVVTKRHCADFTDVTQEEYCESLELTTKLIAHFTQTRTTIKNVYLLNKTGEDAGQSVRHWHLHIILSTNTAQDFLGKITVIKNILLGSSPMKKGDLARKVSALKAELATLKT